MWGLQDAKPCMEVLRHIQVHQVHAVFEALAVLDNTAHLMQVIVVIALHWLNGMYVFIKVDTCRV